MDVYSFLTGGGSGLIDPPPPVATEDSVGTGESNLFGDIVAGASGLLNDYWANERAEDDADFYRELVRSGTMQPTAYTPGPYAGAQGQPSPSATGMTQFQVISLLLAAVVAAAAVWKVFK